MLYQILCIILLIMFYGIYIGKMLAQKNQGIQTDQIAKGNKKKSLLVVEVIMKIATYSVLVVEIISIVMDTAIKNNIIRVIGIGVGAAGVIFFGLAVYTMKDSWRAGIPEKDKTKMITKGIYSISRNPAFVGFDLLYIGVMLVFFNGALLVFSLFAIVMLHLQILQEEAFLTMAFENEYISYKRKVCRYIGRK